MRGVVEQINVSQGGIPKLPIQQARVRTRGIDGDSWAHPRFHGGPKQALLLIAAEDLEDLAALGYTVQSGSLGENLTVRGIPFREVRFGDRFQIGDVVLEITKLRQPCATLNSIGGSIQAALYDTTPGSSKWGRGGFYARVLHEGTIEAGAIIAKANHDV